VRARLIEAPDRHQWELRMVTVTQVIADPGSVRLVAWAADGSLDVRLASPFRLTELDGRRQLIDPEASEQLAPLLSLVSRSLESMLIGRSGTLELRFGDGTVVSAEADAQFESWEAKGSGDLEEIGYLCPPGGLCPWGGAA